MKDSIRLHGYAILNELPKQPTRVIWLDNLGGLAVSSHVVAHLIGLFLYEVAHNVDI